MKSNHTVPYIYASIIAPVPDLIGEQGGNIDRVFRAAGISPELASEPELVIAMGDYMTLLEGAARETGDEQFAVSIAERLEIDDLGPFGRLITGAPTLFGAIATCCRLIHSYSPALQSWLSIKGDIVCWRYRIAGLRYFLEGRRLDCEGTLLLKRAIIRLAAGPNWQPSEVLLEQATPDQLRAYEARFGAPTRGVEGACGLVFGRHLLDLPMTYGEPLGALDRRALLLRLTSTAPGPSFVGSVRAIIRSYLPGGYPEISAAAQASGLSVRTFQRRLDEEGVSYSDLVSDVRCELAQDLLVDPSLSQIEISQTLGYSDPSNFSRAFKNWQGMTPREFRRTSVYGAA